MNSDMELSLLNNDFKTYLSYAIDDLCNKKLNDEAFDSKA